MTNTDMMTQSDWAKYIGGAPNLGLGVRRAFYGGRGRFLVGNSLNKRPEARGLWGYK